MKISNMNTALFKVGFLFRSKDKLRSYINGVYIEPAKNGGLYYVATDANVMSVAYDKDAVHDLTSGVIVNVDFAELNRIKDDTIEIQDKALSGAKKAITLDLIDGTYPVWRKVLPPVYDNATLNSICIQPKYINDFGKVGKLLGQKEPYLKITHGGKMKPVQIKLHAINNWFGILMQCTDNSDNNYPFEV